MLAVLHEKAVKSVLTHSVLCINFVYFLKLYVLYVALLHIFMYSVCFTVLFDE